MTTVEIGTIAPDSALVIDPVDLGSSATGREMEKLFVEFTKRHNQSPWQFELSPEGEIIIMPPVYYPGDIRETALSSHLFFAEQEIGGASTGSAGAYRMPVTGGILCPDAAWTSPERWASSPHSAGQASHLCPDFVAEIRSTSDNLAPLHAKMRLYMRNGALLGWLIDARNRRVYVYRAGQPEPELLEDPATLSGEDVLHGFTFEVARWIFDRV